ncbi:MAG: 5-formyltetrahydrofolate cyclo-ligase [Gammaproteobacteria bacterium]|nr:MAG: 5-formyltetrahydrofolate cyclo-ligase [Gammaproteobacteria bacterium]
MPDQSVHMIRLRSAMRRQRAGLTPAQIQDASARIAHHLWSLTAIARAGRIAGYVAVGGEVDCAAFLAQATARGRKTYLPVIHGETLVFAPAQAPERMVSNRFGIPEPGPDAGPCLRGRDLDVVLTPLVAYDDHGHRLGMGGGFYDRSFAFLRHRGRWRRPLLVGIAYRFQRVESIAVHDWDVSLHAVVNECGASFF